MYRAPQGRPICTPPSGQDDRETATVMRRYRRLTMEEIAGIKRDSDAGMSQRQLAAKWDRSGSIISRVVNMPSSAPPKNRFAPKNPAAWRASVTAGSLLAIKSAEKNARAVCKRLNQTAENGMWLTYRQVISAGLCKTRGGVQKRITQQGYQSTRLGRTAIVFVPNDDKWGKKLAVYLDRKRERRNQKEIDAAINYAIDRVDDAYNVAGIQQPAQGIVQDVMVTGTGTMVLGPSSVHDTPAPPPSLWQRVLSWVGLFR